MTVADLLARLEADMVAARGLGLYRTTDRVHQALNEARSEQYEVTPPTPPLIVDFVLGPVSEQRSQPQR